MQSDRARIEAVIQAYDAQGWHRTASDVDRRNAEWLAEQVRAIGLDPHLEPFTLDRIDPGECYIEVAGERFDAVPLFDATFTGSAGVRGPLGDPASGRPIVLVDSSVGQEQLVEIRSSGEAAALVIATRGPSPGLSLLNAPAFLEPFGPPAIQVGSPVGDLLAEAARASAEALVVSIAARTTSEAFNVTASVPGRDASLPTLAVNTPRSGWWEVAAERGGGLACWLEVMRSLTATEPARPLFFSANSGHELGFLGFEYLLDAHPELIRGATWIHFGANIGAGSGTRGRLQASTEELRRLAEAELASKVSRPVIYPEGAGGEMQVVARRGGDRHMSLTNDNAYFHMPEDRYATNVDVPIVEEFAAAFSAIAGRLAGNAASIS